MMARASSVEQIILDVLSREHEHLTSHQVYERIRSRLPAVNPSTVYRALERLTRAGKVSISDMGTGAAVYELLGGGIHHHLVCQNCGHITTVSHEEMRDLFAAIQVNNQFNILTRHLVLFGVCRSCQDAAGQDCPG